MLPTSDIAPDGSPAPLTRWLHPLIFRQVAAFSAAAGMRAEIEAAPASAAKVRAPMTTLLPHAAEIYGGLVAELKATLESLDLENSQARRRLVEAVRAVVDRVVITPKTQARDGPIDVLIYGTLARFMGGEEHAENALCGAVVAGGGIEPPTCGL